MHQRQEQMRIITRANEMMFIRLLRCTRAIGINYHYFAAPLAQAPQPIAHIRSSKQATIRNQWIGSQ